MPPTNASVVIHLGPLTDSDRAMADILSIDPVFYTKYESDAKQTSVMAAIPRARIAWNDAV